MTRSGSGKHAAETRARRSRTTVLVVLILGIAGFTPALAAKPGGGGTSISVAEYAQCQDGAPPSTNSGCLRWGNGVLNSSNSSYGEDQVTPQRLLLNTTTGSTGNTVTIKYMTRKGSPGVHAYDSLATWNYTQTTADRCLGLKANACPGGAKSEFQMVTDPNPVTPSAVGIPNATSAHELGAEHRKWVMYGGTITGATQPVHSADPNEAGADYATVTVSFTANSSKVMLLFGGHLAAGTGPTGWGAGLGASSISGGPYHIILDALNGASVGSRDNQIMAGAIQPGSPTFVVQKTATPNEVGPNQPVKYDITVTNNGTASGSTTFIDDYDDRLNPTAPAGCTAIAPGGNEQFSCTTNVLNANGGSQLFTYTVNMPGTFTGPAGTDGCDSGKFPVYNKVTLLNGNFDDALVCVEAAPDLDVLKSAAPAMVNPNGTVNYTILITNNGTATGSTTFSDNFDDRLTPSTPSVNQYGGSCALVSQGDKRFECTSGDIPAGQSQTWTYTAQMPDSFSGAPGGDGCNPTGPNQQYPIRNVVVLDSGGGDDAVVCVNAEPAFTVLKSANPAVTTPGGTVTYTIVVTNGGKAAGSTTFKDDFDDAITPVTPSGCELISPNGNDQFSCTTGTIAPNNGTQTFTYTATMPTEFEGVPGGNGCNPAGTNQQYPIRNVVVLANTLADDSVVCVAASPDLRVEKSVSPTIANPNQTVTYTIRVINDGAAPGSMEFEDDYDDRVQQPTTPTPDQYGGSCVNKTNGNDRFECISGTVPAGETQIWTYTAKMPGTFSGAPGGNGCPPGPNPPGRYPVRNVVVLDNGEDGDATVCVNAEPTFTVEKSANPTTAIPGQLVTYTIKVTNGGTASGSTTWSDNFDDRLAPSNATTSGGPDCVPGATAFTNCSTGTIDAGASKSWTYTANMPEDFGGAPGGDGCNPAGENQQFPVRNVVVLANTGSDDSTVCVDAAPEFDVTKTAPATAGPGDTVTYTILVENIGKASGSTSFIDDYDDRLSPTVPAGCTPIAPGGNEQFDCDTGTIAAGDSQTFTYTAAMPTSFSGAPGGNGCNPAGNGQQYPIRNVVVLDNGTNDDAVVCVNAAPNLTLVKSVQKTTDMFGREVLTYTLTYTNTGAAAAPAATIAETVPDGTSYQSCTGGCLTGGIPVSGVTWTVGPVAPKGGTGSVTMTVIVTTTVACEISNTAQISAPGFNGGDPADSNTVSVNVTPLPDPDNANTSGSSYGAQVGLYALLVLNTREFAPSATEQQGIGGPVTSNDELIGVTVPAVLEASVMRTTSRSQISEFPAMASSTSTSEVLGLCIIRVLLTCAVEASTVRSVAYAEATGTGSAFSAAGSTIENLKIAGVATPVNLNQTTTIPLPAAVFGAGSYVAINERSGGTTLDTSGPIPRYRADLTVNLIRVHVTGALGVVRADVTVAHAEAHADFPVQKLCGPVNDASVAGHAFIAHAAVLPPLVLATQGFVSIPTRGGSASQSVASVNALQSQLLTAGAASTGVLGSTGPPAVVNSQASVANLCLLKFPGSSNCVVMAEAVRSISVSAANAGSALSRDQSGANDRTQLVNLVIRSAPNAIMAQIPLTVAPNTTITIPGIGFLVLNEQFCDGGATLNATAQPRCTGTTHSGLTVRALHLVLLQNFGPFNPGVEVIVAEAYSGATDN